MRNRHLLLIAALLLPGCRAVGSPPHAKSPEASARAPEATWVDVWVEGGRVEEGEGSRERPYRRLGVALRHPRLAGVGLRVHVAEGLYAGPFELPRGVEVEGKGEGTVLYVEGREGVVRAPQGGTLKGLSVQGGSWGVEGEGRVRLEGVKLRGQREGAVRMVAGRLEVKGGAFEAGLSETVGLSLGGRARAWVKGSTFTGPYRRGVAVEGGGEAELEQVRFEGPVTAVHQVGGRVEVRHGEVAGGRGPGLFVAGGWLRLEDVKVQGHEYGLQSREAEVEVKGFTSRKAERAGVGLVKTKAVLEGLVVEESGDFGGVSLVASRTVLRGFRVEGAEAYGLTVTQGRLEAREGQVGGIRDAGGAAGDGVHLREAQAELEDVVVRRVAGAGVLVAQEAEVELRRVRVEEARVAGVVAETFGRVMAVGLEVRGSAGVALAALEQGVVRVDGLKVSGLAEGLVWAECAQGVEVSLGHVEADEGQALGGQSLPCVGRWEAPRRK